MSTIKVDSIKSADGNTDLLTLSNGAVSGVNLGRRNLIINGAMQVAQRGTSTTEVNDYGSVDRFKSNRSGYDNHLGTQAQVTDAPDGFGFSLKHTVTTPETTVDAANIYRVMHFIESQNLQALKYGTSSAQDCTISFWVKGSVTGTYVFSVYADASGGSRLWTKTYTIDTANTWEYKTITIPPDTTRAIDNDNTEGLRLQWILGSGSNYTATDSTSWIDYGSGGLAYGHNNDFVTTSNATWQLTGVQLEVGSVATPFEHRSYGEELALCQRYCTVYGGEGRNYHNVAEGFVQSDDYPYVFLHLPVEMRTNPSFTYSGNWIWVNYNTVSLAVSGNFGIGGSTEVSGKVVYFSDNQTNQFNAGNEPILLRANNDGSAKIILSAEL